MRERNERVFADPPQPQREMGKTQGLVQVTAQSSTKMCFWEGAKVLKGDGSPCSFCGVELVESGLCFVLALDGGRSIWGLDGVCF